MFKIRFLIITLALILAACTPEKDENTWIVGISADNPPYEFMQDGEIVGFDIDFIREVARHLGKKVEFKNIEFHSLLAAVASKNVDLIVSGLSVTEERLRRVDFSLPYTSAVVAVLFRREDAFRSGQDMKRKKVGAQLGSLFSLVAHDMAVKYESEVNSLANNLMLVEELKSKRIDAVVLEEAQATKFVQKYPQLAQFSMREFSSSFAIAMPKDSRLKKNINHTIKALKSNGTIIALEKKWGITGDN